MQQVQSPDATLWITLRFRGEVIGQMYVQATIEEWEQISHRPFAHTGDERQHDFGEHAINFMWIGPRGGV